MSQTAQQTMQTTKTPPRLLPPKQAAVELGVSEYALRAMIKAKQIPTVKAGIKNLLNVTRLLSRLEETGSFTD
jgi:hypothetical protein